MITPFTNPGRIRTANLSTGDALRRWPRLTAHMIAESLGCFSPDGAANALLLFKRGQENWCEWYVHMASVGRKPILQVAAETLRRAVRGRGFHRSYMADYALALKIVQRRVATGVGPIFGSWF